MFRSQIHKKYVYFQVMMAFVFFIIVPVGAHAYDVPELIYYKFDNTGGSTVQNDASAPVGTNPAPVVNLAMGGTGQFGSALMGTGGSSSSDYVNTEWPVNLTGSWTISFWLNNIPNNTMLYYLFGDDTATSFRCFLGGVAGAGNVIIRGGGLSDLIISGVAAAQPAVLHFVYDSTNDQIRGYLNGVLNNTVNDATTDVTGTTGPFKIGGYSTSAGMPNGSLMDEFRVYNRALSPEEIAETWNRELPTTTESIPSLTQRGTIIFGLLMAGAAIVLMRRGNRMTV